MLVSPKIRMMLLKELVSLSFRFNFFFDFFVLPYSDAQKPHEDEERYDK